MEMEFNIADPTTLSALIEFTETGATAGCPFCKGRMIASVSPEDRIIILKGMYVGREATVSHEPGLSDDEFLVKFDSDPPNQLTRIAHKRDVFAYSPLGEIPNWLCSLSIDDLCTIDHSALDLAVLLAVGAKKSFSPNTRLPLIATVRQRRLPMLSVDLWPTLEAHGIPKPLKHDFCRKFDFAIELLVSLHGRPAVQKRRVRAMSIGRYLTAGEEEHFGPSPGI
jgi:hypothetical protein